MLFMICFLVILFLSDITLLNIICFLVIILTTEKVACFTLVLSWFWFFVFWGFF